MLLALVVGVAVPVALASTAKVGSQALARSGDTRLERELVPAGQAALDPQPFVVARGVIPPDESYAVVAAPAEGVPAIAVDGAPQFAGYLLLPRRRLLEPLRARWLIAYGVTPRELGLPHRVVRRVEPFGAIARR